MPSPHPTSTAGRKGVAFGDGPGLTRRATVTDRAEHVLSLEGADVPALAAAPSDRFRHVLLDGRPQAGQVAMHEHATELLAGLLLSRSSVFWEWAPDVEAIVFAPEHLDPPRLRRSMDAGAPSVPRAA